MIDWRDDLRIDVIRPESRGGQHVGVRIDPVRVTHLPTGIMAQCGEMRSQHQNRRVAIEMVYARQYNEELRRHNSILSESEGRLSTSVTVLSQQVSALMSQNISLRHPSSVVSAANSAFSGDRAATG